MSPDPKNNNTISVVRPAVAFAANANINGIDLRDYIGNVAVIFNVGQAWAGTSPTYDAYLRSGSSSDGTNASNLNISLTQVANTNSLQVLSVDTRTAGRYLNIVQTIGGSSSPNFAVGIQQVGQKTST